MDAPTKTRKTLVLRLRDPTDREAWGQFVRLYSPLVYRFLRRRGLQDADAADVSQEVFRTVAQSIGKFDYDPDRGSFRGWLRKITWCRLHEFLVRRQGQAAGSGDSAVKELIEQCPSSQDHDPDWEQEYHRRLFEWAAGQIRKEFRDNTWQAFWRTAVEGAGTEDVARELGMSGGAIYVARSRVFARLRREVQGVDDHAWADLEPKVPMP